MGRFRVRNCVVGGTGRRLRAATRVADQRQAAEAKVLQTVDSVFPGQIGELGSVVLSNLLVVWPFIAYLAPFIARSSKVTGVARTCRRTYGCRRDVSQLKDSRKESYRPVQGLWPVRGSLILYLCTVPHRPWGVLRSMNPEKLSDAIEVFYPLGTTAPEGAETGPHPAAHPTQ